MDWKGILEGTDPTLRRARTILGRIPSNPRCHVCAAPFQGPGAPFMAMMGRKRWAKNPKYCTACTNLFEGQGGGAELEISILFADVRGSTTLGEQLGPRAFSELLNRFYEVTARTIVGHEGIVDKFVGDGVVAIFLPVFTGADHASPAIAAARDLLRETGHGSAVAEPWLPIGAGVHSGMAFVGAVGEGAVTDFTALGDSVNSAARLSSAAGPGEVLVSRAAATSAGFATDGLESRRLELRGRVEPMDVVVAGPTPVPGVAAAG